MHRPSLADSARVALAGIRIVNGAGGLLDVETASELPWHEEAAGPMGYPFRMFGIRTILIGLDLLSDDRAVRRHALRAAVVVHVTDTVSAIVTGVTGGLPRRPAVTTTAISATNAVLALLASRKA